MAFIISYKGGGSAIKIQSKRQLLFNGIAKFWVRKDKPDEILKSLNKPPIFLIKPKGLYDNSFFETVNMPR